MAVLTDEFIKEAQRLQKKTGIPASITLAQLMKESGGKYPGGLSGLAYNDKNLFGVKGRGTAGSVFYPTPEYENGRYKTIQAAFKKFHSYSEAFDDRAVVLSHIRYQKAFKGAKSVNDYAHGLQKAGYATDPNYAKGLLGLITDNNLHKYDLGNYEFTPVAGTGNSGSVGESVEDDSKGFAGELLFAINRIVLVLIFLILTFIFFMKAFPAVDSVVSEPAKLLNPVKKIKTVKKVAKSLGGTKK